MNVKIRAPLIGFLAGVGTWLLLGVIPLALGITGCLSVLFALVIGPAAGFMVLGYVQVQVHEAERAEVKLKELNREKDERGKAFAKFQKLIQQLHPEWLLIEPSYTDWSVVGLHATCRYEQESVDLRIEFTGTITTLGDLEPGTSVSFSARSSSVNITLIDRELNKTDAAFEWLADYVRNSKPFISLRERKRKLKRSLGF